MYRKPVPRPAATAGSIRRGRPFLLALGLGCLLNLLFVAPFVWYYGPGGRQATVVSRLRDRVAELERDAAAAAVGGDTFFSVGSASGAIKDIPCRGCDRRIAAELNRRFNFFVLNLDRRPDKMRCVRDQFARFGIHVRRMHGIDSLRMDLPNLQLLNSGVKVFLKNNPGQIGHVGCLYGHIRFFMGAASGRDGCGPEDASLRSDESGTHDASVVHLTLRNRWPAPVDVFLVRENGQEEKRGTIQKGHELRLESSMLQAWRIRDASSRAQLLQMRLEHHITPSSSYTMNLERTEAVAYVFGCPPKPNAHKVSIIFEDDVVLREDFAEKLLWSFGQADAKGESWDIFLLNWYCNSGHWKQCNKNKGTPVIAEKPWTDLDRRLYGYTKNLGKYSIPRVKYFMSGGGYAVSHEGAAKLLATFPCDQNRYTCSMAVDWHMSTLIDTGVISVLGASPPFVLMPEMGSVQSLGIRTPPRREMQKCGKYKSDTHYEG